MIRKVFLAVIIIAFICSSAIAQESVEMADVMRSNGKIYVVVAVAAVVLFGLIGYLISIDRKLSKIEKEIESKSKN